MGQKLWAIACALGLTAAVATHLAAQQADNPFGSAPAEQPGEPGRPDPGARSYTPGEARQRIEAALDLPLREPVDFVDQPLRDVMTILAETYDIPILFDVAALDAVAASPDVEVSINIANVTLRSALDLMLKNAGGEELTYVIDKEVLLITTEEEASTRLETKVYRVDHLRPRRAAEPAGASAWADFDALIDLITSCIEPDSWAENGKGEGQINPHGLDVLVIMQTNRVHQQIEKLLVELGAAHKEVQAAASESLAGAPITRGIPILSEPVINSDADRQLVRDLMMRSVDWAPTGDISDEDVFFEIIAGRIYVRHSPKVVQQVEDVAHAMQLVPIGGAGFSGGGGFGGVGGFGARPPAKERPKATATKPDDERKSPATGTGVF